MVQLITPPHLRKQLISNSLQKRKVYLSNLIKPLICYATTSIVVWLLFAGSLYAQTQPTYHSIYYYVGADANDFMNIDNSTLLYNIRSFGCNSIFMSMKTLQAGSDPNAQNLGLMQCNSNATYPYGYSGVYAYRNKVTDFIHQASTTNPPIKVFGLLVETEDFIDKDNTEPAFRKLKNIAKYQHYARQTFPDKYCLLNGVVTNIEPWTIVSSVPDPEKLGPINIGGTNYNWHTSFCGSANRSENEIIMNYYLSFISEMRLKLVNELFFNPLQPTGNPQVVDDVFMGTTQWFLHYFSERTKWEISTPPYFTTDGPFPSGNFSLMVGPGKFDIILPQTYCGKDGSCLTLNCTTNLTSFCRFVNGFEDEEEGDNSDADIHYNEKVGGCCDWFFKHFLTNEMYIDDDIVEPPYTLPVDAAPMLYGHTAAHPDDVPLTRKNVKDLRYNAAYITYCKEKPYRGSVLFDYDRMMALPVGNNNQAQLCDCDIRDTQESLSINSKVFSISPNPSNSTIFIEGLDGSQTVLVFDFMNELRIEGHKSPLDVSVLPEGFYALVIVDASNNVLYRKTVSIGR